MKKVLFGELAEGIFMERVVRDYDAMTHKHLHNEYEIYYLMEGEQYYFIDEQTYLVKRGCLVFLDSRQIHKTSHAGDPYHERILLEIRGEEFRPFMSALMLDFDGFFREHSGVMELNRDEQLTVEGILFAMMGELKERKEGCEAMVKMELARLLIFAHRKAHDSTDKVKPVMLQSSKHQKVHEVVEYIAKNCETAQSLEDLSKRFYVSKCYLSRIFKEVTGFTVNEFINVQRVKKAQQMLTETDEAITEIAHKLGYESVTYFEKVFKRYSEDSPLKYRKKQRSYMQHLKEQERERIYL